MFKLIPVREVMQRLDISKSTLYRHVAKGELPKIHTRCNKSFFLMEEYNRYEETGDWRLAKN